MLTLTPRPSFFFSDTQPAAAPAKCLHDDALFHQHPEASDGQAVGAQGIFKCAGMTVEINAIAGDAADPYL